MNNNEEEKKTAEATLENPPSRPKSWWKRKEIIGSVGLVILNGAASPIVGTISPWIPAVANVILGLLTVTGWVEGMNAKNLKPTPKNYKIVD